MRLLLLSDTDPSVFEEELLPSHQSFFLRHENEIINMIDDQTTGFWLRYAITFRSVLYKKGFIPENDERRVFAEEAFIDIVNLMTDFSNRRAYGLKQLMTDIRMFYKYDHIVGRGTISVNQCMSLPGVRDSLKRLFGKAKDTPKKHVKFIPFTRLAASLVNCYQKWENAEQVECLRNIPWTAPDQWHNAGTMQQAFIFEGYIKGNWGEELINLVAFDSPNIAWWDNIEEIIITKRSSLSKKFPLTVLLNRNTPTGARGLSPDDRSFTSLFSKERPQNDPVYETDDDDDLYQMDDYVHIQRIPPVGTVNESSAVLNNLEVPTHDFPEPAPEQEQIQPITQPNQVSEEEHHKEADTSSDLASKMQAHKKNAPRTRQTHDSLHVAEMLPIDDSNDRHYVVVHPNAGRNNQTHVQKEWKKGDKVSSHLDSQQTHAFRQWESEIGTVPQALYGTSDQIPAQSQWSEEGGAYGQSKIETRAPNLPNNRDTPTSYSSSENTDEPWWKGEDGFRDRVTVIIPEDQLPGPIPIMVKPIDYKWKQNVSSEIANSRKRHNESVSNNSQQMAHPGSSNFQRRGYDRSYVQRLLREGNSSDHAYVQRLLTEGNSSVNDFDVEVMGNNFTQEMPRRPEARYYVPSIEYYMDDDHLFYHPSAQYGNHDLAESNDQPNQPPTSAQSRWVGRSNNESTQHAELVKRKNDTNTIFNKNRRQTTTHNRNVQNMQTQEWRNLAGVSHWNLPAYQPQFTPQVAVADASVWAPPSQPQANVGNNVPSWIVPVYVRQQNAQPYMQPGAEQNYLQNSGAYYWDTNPRDPNM